MNRTNLITTLALLLCTQAIAQPERVANTIVLDEDGARNLRIETAEVVRRNFETTLFAIGRIEEIPANRSVLSSRIAGRVVELNAFVGDTVEAGQVLAKVESRQLGNPPPTITLSAQQSGLVVESHVRLGQPVEPDVELLDISDRSQLWAVAKIPERDAAAIKVGTKARIRIPALGDEVITATLSRFGVDADRQTDSVEGIFVLDNPRGKIRPGMRAEFSLILNRRYFILAVPRAAVQGDPARRVAFLKDFALPYAYLRQPVVLGEQNDEYVEVISGLEVGNEVVTQGSYALSFVGPGAGISLKEALDAAHGHEHNEDGSEMTPEQRAASKNKHEGHEHGDEHDHDEDDGHAHGELSKPLLTYALVATALLLICLQQLWKRRQAKQEASDVK